jgi:hypothetical protein
LSARQASTILNTILGGKKGARKDQDILVKEKVKELNNLIHHIPYIQIRYMDELLIEFRKQLMKLIQKGLQRKKLIKLIEDTKWLIRNHIITRPNDWIEKYDLDFFLEFLNSKRDPSLLQPLYDHYKYIRY